MVLRTATNLLDQEDCYDISLKKFYACNFVVTDNCENFSNGKNFPIYCIGFI